MTTGPEGPTRPRGDDARRWRALAVCLVAGFMTLLDVSIVNVALPSMQEGLSATPTALTWIVSGYALTFGLVLVPSGRLGDDHGRGRMFLIALASFTAASAFAGFATNEVWLVLARLLQGAAGGMMNPQVLGLIQQLFRGRARGTAFGLFGAVVGLSTAIGPLTGGLIIALAGNEQGWRWVFFVNVPIGVAALIGARWALPREAPGSASWRNIDIGGVLLLGAGLLCLLLPLVESGGTVWYLAMVAPVLLAGFVAWEHFYRLRGATPLVDLRLLRTGSYAFGVTLGLLYFAGFTSIFFVLALYFQRGLGYSALQSGLAITAFAVGSAVSSAYSGRMVYRMGRRLVIIGLIGALAGLLATDRLLSVHFGAAAGAVTALPLLVAGLGSGLVISPNQTVTLSEVNTAQGGTAAGVQQTAQRLGSALGTATASGLFFGALPAGYDAAISTGMEASVCFVAAALLTALTELIVTARRGVRAPSR